MKKKYNNADKEKLRYIFFWIAGLILFAWALLNFDTVLIITGKLVSWFAPVLIGAGIAFIINVLMRPMEKFWEKHFVKDSSRLARKLKRPVCLVLSTVVIFGLLFAVIFMMVPGLQHSTEDFISHTPEYADRLNGWWSSIKGFAERHKVVLPEFSLERDTLIAKLSDFFKSFGKGLVSATLNASRSFMSGLINVLLAVVFAMYLLAEKEKVCFHLKQLLLRLCSEKTSKRTLKIVNLTNQTFTSFISGQLIDASILGILCFIGMLILRIPYAGIVSVLIATTALIPVFGAWIGGGLSTFLILMSSPISALWFLILLAFLQQFEGNFIYPKVVGKSIGLPGILVMFSVTVGGAAFGILGMLLGIPACAVVYSLYKDFMNSAGEQEKNGEPELPESGALTAAAEETPSDCR